MADNSIPPGFRGISPPWTSSAKSGIGKSINFSSDVVFTLSHGILNEVYYPREDIACIREILKSGFWRKKKVNEGLIEINKN